MATEQLTLNLKKGGKTVKKLFVLALPLVVLCLVSCKSQKSESPKAVAAQSHADTNLLELVRELEKTLQRAVDIHAVGSDTNRLLRELEKARE